MVDKKVATKVDLKVAMDYLWAELKAVQMARTPVA